MNKKIIHLVVALLLAHLQAGPAFALPAGESVQSGDVTFDRSTPNELYITASDKAIINYDSFSIGASELTNFIQPSANAVVLNRVVGGNPSEIFGQLTSNGHVFLVNPSGILFGPSSSINVGGLVASTGSISDQDFLNSNYLFTNIQGLLKNQGTLRSADGGHITLIGNTIENTGSIIAPLGTVILAAGEKATLELSPGISIIIEDPSQLNPDDVDDQIKSTGTIQANGGNVYIEAQGAAELFQNAINIEGLVQANAVEENNGIIKLVASEDIRVDATFESRGGGIEVITPKHFTSSGTMDATGGYIYLDPDFDIVGTQTYFGATVVDAGYFRVHSGGSVSADNTLTINATSFIQVDAGASMASAGAMTLSSPTDITIAGALSTTSGNISITADNDINGSGTFSLGATNMFAGGVSTITVSAAGFEVTSGDLSITTVSGSSGSRSLFTNRHTINYDDTLDFTLSATNGTITTGQGGGKFDPVSIPGTDLTISAQTIGTSVSSPLRTAVTTLDLTSTNGGIYLIDTNNSVTLTSADSSAGNGEISIGSNFIEIGTVNAGSGDITLGSGILTDNDANSSVTSTGTVNLIGDGFFVGLGFIPGNIGSSSNRINTTAGTLVVTGGQNGTYITESDGATLSSVTACCNGLIDIISTTGNLELGTVTAGSGDISLTASSGSITDSNGDSSLANSGTLTLTANSINGGIGTSGNKINTTATTIIGTAGSGGIYITESNGATLSNLNSSGGNGTINIDSTTGSLEIGTVNAGSGSVTLAASAGSITDSDGNNSITSSTGTVTLTVNSTTGGVGTSSNKINTTAGTIASTAGSGGIYIIESNGAVLSNLNSSGGNGEIDVTSTTGDLSITSTNSGTGATTLTATTGSILDNDTSSNDITASSTTLTAGNTIGGINNPLDTSIGAGTLSVSASGKQKGVSINISGSISPSNSLTLVNTPPGLIIYNGGLVNQGSSSKDDFQITLAEEVDVQPVLPLNPPQQNLIPFQTPDILENVGVYMNTMGLY